MATNNVLLYTFGVIFLFLGFLSPLINSEFNQEYSDYDDEYFEETGQLELSDLSGITSFFSGLFFWVFGAPLWLNIFITMMRVIFWVIVYDKFRGIGS